MIYLLHFDKYIIDKCVKGENCFFRRYSDDIIIIFENQTQFNDFDKDIREQLSSEPFLLTINSGKTIVSKFEVIDGKIICSTKEEGAPEFSESVPSRYLGFDGEKIYIKDASVSNYYRELKKAVRTKGNRVKAAKKFNAKNPEVEPKDTKLYLTNLIKRFTHLGKKKTKSNFLTYADRSAKIMYSEFDEKKNPIRNQLKRSWSIFNKTANRYR